MQNVISFSSTAATAVLVIQAVLVLARTPFCVRRSVPILLSVFLGAIAARLALPTAAVLHELLTIGIIWSAGAFLIRAMNRRLFGAWAGVNLAFLFTLCLARGLGYESAVTYAALREFGIGLLSVIPLGMLARIWNGKRCVPALATFLAGCLWLIIGGLETVGGFAAAGRGQAAGVPGLLLSFCTGWLIFQEGYPERVSWRGSLRGLKSTEGLTQSMYARLLATESALAWQERITAAGFLALGAAHEFKNTLSHVRLAAQHGLAQGEPGRKDECLCLILENADAGRDSAVEVLERISSNGGESFRDMEAARDLTLPIRRAGAALRGEGIIVQTLFDPGVMFRARRFDVEQIILNLIHNSAESYRRRPGEENGLITVRARTEEEWAVIEVCDSAGGVEDGLRHRLFTPAASSNGSTGLGLYMSRNLALANGGSLDFQPLEGGSEFRLSLPAVDTLA